jgi:hypothetical protein
MLATLSGLIYKNDVIQYVYHINPYLSSGSLMCLIRKYDNMTENWNVELAKEEQLWTIGTSENYDTSREDQLPSTKAVKAMIDSNNSNSGGVGEEEVMQIIEENSATTEELEVVESETLNIGTSNSYDETSDSEVPTTKAVKTMMNTIIGNVQSLLEEI